MSCRSSILSDLLIAVVVPCAACLLVPRIAGTPAAAKSAAAVLTPQVYLPAALLRHQAEDPAFVVSLVPDRIRDCIPGQRCMFLLALADRTGGAGARGLINLSADAPGATLRIEPEEMTVEQVAEVNLFPVAASVDETLTLTVRAEREGEAGTARSLVDVTHGDLDDYAELTEMAVQIRGEFIPWLAANRPELAIDEETPWENVVVTPNILVVMHHLFFSEEWEMELRWHVMIPPHDWARIYLRHRFDEVRPSYAFEISSRTAGDEPIPIDPPPTIWR